MSRPVITVENLSKAYRIGLRAEVPDTLTAAITGWARAPLRNLQRLRRLHVNRDTLQSAAADSGNAPDADDVFWALRDVSFEVNQGEVLGIIGGNGAGKSTLLKILSRITEPTSGRAVIRGRISSLLEVGTGFHPELTGRENIYMNGTLLGMRKREIDRRFDEIVDFSGVERFLDTPIKRYSSGMKVRLAFAVAAHLEPEVLIIDEVLAVGDAEFQQKCLGKMQDVATSGRTVLFVSHNMNAITELCSRGVLLQCGRASVDGNLQHVIRCHLSSQRYAGSINLSQWKGYRTGAGPLRVANVQTLGDDHEPLSGFSSGRGLRIRATIHGPQDTPITIAFSIRTETGNLVLHCGNTDYAIDFRMPDKSACVELSIPPKILADGSYSITIWLGSSPGTLHDRVADCLHFTIGPVSNGHNTALALSRPPVCWDFKAA